MIHRIPPTLRQAANPARQKRLRLLTTRARTLNVQLNRLPRPDQAELATPSTRTGQTASANLVTLLETIREILGGDA